MPSLVSPSPAVAEGNTSSSKRSWATAGSGQRHVQTRTMANRHRPAEHRRAIAPRPGLEADDQAETRRARHGRVRVEIFDTSEGLTLQARGEEVVDVAHLRVGEVEDLEID